MGNEATCSIQGFMLTLWGIVPSYNAMLCIYFLHVIRDNLREDVLESYERYMHLVVVLPVFIIAIVAVSNNLFNNNANACWLVEPDRYLAKKAGEEDETSGSTNVLKTVYILFYIQSVNVACIIAYCMRKIYTSVRHRAERMNQYNFSLQSANATGSQSSRNSAMNEVLHVQWSNPLYTLVLTYFHTDSRQSYTSLGDSLVFQSIFQF